MEKRRSSWEIEHELIKMVHDYTHVMSDPEVSGVDAEQYETKWWEQFDAVVRERNAKLFACKVVIERSKLEAEEAMKRSRQWSNRARMLKGLAERLSENAVGMMTANNDKKVTLSDNSKATLCERTAYDLVGELCTDSLPDRFIKKEVNKGLIKKALRQKEEVKGVTLKERTTRFIRWSI